jgi:Uma2 family endonuclease
MTARQPEMGPYRAEDIRPGEPYELDNGYRVHCEPGGGSHSKPNFLGVAVVGFDPKVGEERDAGTDTGFKLNSGVVRAPDVAVGKIPSEPGWVEGAPELAIEYADVGQDEIKLQEKIRQFLGAGTKYIWVVRLVGPRRVEVYKPGKAVQIVWPGAELAAPGVLQNPVLVEALYERDAAERATLTNLLQRKGYQDLDAVLAAGVAKGRAEGRAEGLSVARAAVRDLCELLDVRLSPEREAALGEMQIAELDALRELLKRDRRWD